MSEQGTVDALGRCSRCGQHVQSSAGCDCHTRPTNDAKAINAWKSRHEPVKTMEDELEIGSKAIADLIAHMERMGVSSVEDGNFKAVLTPGGDV